MSKRRDYGSGAIESRGTNSWRLRYRIGGKVFRKTVKGNKTEAQKVLRQLLHAGDVGEHVAPDKMTLQQWAEHWLSVRPIGQRARERYEQLLRVHILPALGDRPLQELGATEIDKFYVELKGHVSHRGRSRLRQELDQERKTAAAGHHRHAGRSAAAQPQRARNPRTLRAIASRPHLAGNDRK
jgi:Phage integrase, N-terminal SAM-like domain